MRAVTALVTFLSLSGCGGFSLKRPEALQKLSSTAPCSGALFASQRPNADDDDGGNAAENQAQTKAAAAVGFTAALALGWIAGTGASFAATATLPPNAMATYNDWTTTGMGSSVVVALSDSDYVDFSMPSYAETNAAGINSNLKGDKFLLGEASKAYSATSTSSGDDEAVVVAKKQKAAPSEADIKAEKDAAKAAQKAAKERQKAAIEAAAAAAAAS